MILIVFFMILISFALVFMCAKYSQRLLLRYPDVNCETLPDNESAQSLQKAALREWNLNQALTNRGVEKVTYEGYV